MTSKERLKEFLKANNLSEGKFERLVGLSNGFVSNVGDSIRTKNLEKITNMFPSLNTAWLLTGAGEMLITKAASEWKPPADELLALRVTVKVLSQELAKVQSKLYNRPLEDCLNELEQNTILTLRSEMKGGGGV